MSVHYVLMASNEFHFPDEIEASSSLLPPSSFPTAYERAQTTRLHCTNMITGSQLLYRRNPFWSARHFAVSFLLDRFFLPL